MKRRFTKLMAALALLTFLAVPLGMWGQTREDQTATWTATSGGLGSGIGSGTITDNGNFSWSYTRTLISGTSYTGWTSNCIQLGKNGGVENLTLTTSAIPGIIKSVAVECSSYQGKHNVSITVGGNTYLASTGTSSWTTVGTATGTGTSSGTITIAFTGGTRALYIKSITVVYDNSSGPTTYTVTYNGNGNTSGDVPVDNTDYEEGDEVTVLGPGNLAKTGHTFAWWSDMQDGTDEDAHLYDEDDTFEITENTTLYAQWSVNTYNYTLNVTGDDGEAMAELQVDGSTVAQDAKIAYDKEVTVVVATNTGYNYSIEVKDADNNDIPVANDKFTMPASDVTVSVTTTLIPTYTITFIAGSGTCNTPTMSGLEGSTITLPTATPSEACASRGWEFAGWATTGVSETTNAPTLLNGDYTITADADLYAVYKVTEEGQGGETVFNFAEIASQNGWSSGTAYTTVSIDPITLTANGGGNNGKYYSSDHSWRLYNGGSMTITSTSGPVTSVESTPSKEFSLNSDGSASCSFTATTQFTEITVTYGTSTTTYNSNPSCLPKVATPTFNPAAGKVETGTLVTISCTTEDAAIQYSTDGITYNDYSTPIAINEDITLYAKATKAGCDDSEVASATYTLNEAEFVNGVYTEPLNTVLSFEKMTVVNVQGDEEWYFETPYNCATIQGDASGDVDWLITPRMQVDNGKLAISFNLWHSSNITTNLLSLKWSTSNDVVNGQWTTVDYVDLAGDNSFHEINVDITTQEPYVYMAFVYDNTNDGTTGEYSIKNFNARQCKTLTVSNLDHVNTYLFAGTESEMLFEGEGEALIGVGMQVMISVDVEEDYQLTSLLVNSVEHSEDVEGDMYSFTMPNETVAVTASATAIPYYYVSYFTNGIADGTARVVQGQAIGTLPTATPEYIPADYVFMGWLASEYQVSDDAPNAYIDSDYIPQGDVTLYAVFAQVNGSVSTGELSGDEIAANFAATAQSYSDDERSFEDGEFTWAARCITNKDRHWIQLKSDNNVYIKIVAPDNIQNVEVVISNTNNSSGGIDNINMHGAFDTSGHIYLNPSNGGDPVGTTLGSAVVNYVATVVPSGNNSTLYLQVDKGARVWGVTVTCGSATYSNYRTSYTKEYALEIVGYGNDQDKDGYYLIASPVYVDPATVEGMTEGDYDLYYFDEAQDHEEWRNYEAGNFTFVPGTGYLYAKKATAATPTYNFTLEGAPYNGNGQVTLSKANGTQFSGWNLIGNPYANAALLQDANQGNRAYYKMNPDGDELEPVNDGAAIAAMEGVFVYTETDGETVTFVPSNTGNGDAVSQLSINVGKSRGEFIDRAFVRFDNGNQLPKFQLNPKHTKVYFQQDNKDYAVVRSTNEGEMPVNFKAETRGTYTLSVNAENVEMSYLHLIDNMTGTDVDLLQTPSYTFEAKTSDYASRFRLMFSANSISEDADGDNAFAYFNGSNWTVSNMGEATLQVVDVMGRVLSSEQINGNAEININQPTGVYMLRLLNENNVRVQKIVVR